MGLGLPDVANKKHGTLCVASPGETGHLLLPLRSLISRAASLSAIVIFATRGKQSVKVDLSRPGPGRPRDAWS